MTFKMVTDIKLASFGTMSWIARRTKVIQGYAAPFKAQSVAVGNLAARNICYLENYCLEEVDMYRRLYYQN